MREGAGGRGIVGARTSAARRLWYEARGCRSAGGVTCVVAGGVDGTGCGSAGGAGARPRAALGDSACFSYPAGKQKGGGVVVHDAGSRACRVGCRAFAWTGR